MDKHVTNGMLLLLERQGRDLENAICEVERLGVFTKDSDALLAKLKVELVNWNQKLLEVRGWNFE